MKKTILFLLMGVALFSACNLSGYKKTKTGLYYKIFPSGGKKLKVGQYVKMHINGFIRDSAFFNTRDAMAFYGQVDSAGRPYDFTEIISLLSEGDSAVAIQSVDSLLKMPGIQLPPYMHKGDKIKSCLKVVKVFDSVSAAQESYSNDLVIFREKEDAKNAASFKKAKEELDQYVAKNKVVATQTAKGVYVEVKQAGTGAVADSGKLAGVKYNGTLLDGTFFDGNMSPDRNDTMRFVIGGGRMIAAFDEGVRGQRVGAKLKLYIPAQFGYGAQGNGPIKPFSNLIFDINLVEVKDLPARPQQAPVIAPVK